MILYGKPVVLAIETELKQEIARLVDLKIQPFLAVILVGDDPASVLYTRKKEEKAQSLGIGFKLYSYPASVSQADLLLLIDNLNHDVSVHGIIIQLPLPQGFDTAELLSQISKEKDVDGLNGGLVPPAAGAVLELLNFYKIDLTNKKVVLVGRGKLVGGPLEDILTQRNIDLTVCDSKTVDLKEETLKAKVIISAVGKPNLITKEMVGSEAIVIDAGTAESNGSTIGDLSPSVYNYVQSYSPVPGGIGPITVAKLLKNVVEAADFCIGN